MSQLFDLNVSNYSLKELLNFFGVDKNDDAASVERNCNDLKKKIQTDPKLGPVTKGKMHEFLNKAVVRLTHARNTTTELFESSRTGSETSNNGLTAEITAAIKASAPAPAPTTFMQLKNDVEEHGNNFLITPPSEQAGIAGNFKNGKTALTGAPPGIVNPVAMATIKRALNVDTRFRSNYYSTKSTDFVYNLPYKFENITSMSVATYELPLTYYAISQQYENNCIIFQWKFPGSENFFAQQYTLVIPDGNYNASFQSGGGSFIESTINGILKGTQLVYDTGLAYTVDKTSGRSIFSCNSATDASGNVFPYSPDLATTTVFMIANASTTSAPPNASQIIWNNTSQTLSNSIYFSQIDVNTNAVDLSAYISSTLTITDGTNVQTFTVSNVTDTGVSPNNYWTVNVSNGLGPSIANGSAIKATFTTIPVHTPFTGVMRIVFNARAGINRKPSSSVVTATPTTSYQDDIQPLPYFLGWQLGFRTAIYEMGADVDSIGNNQIPQSAVSEGICLITGPQYVFFCIDDYNNNVNNYYASAYSSSTIAPNIIARLNIKQQLNSAGSYGVVSGESLSTSLTYSREYFGPVDIQRMRITLIDDFGRVLDLNNMDWSFALMFECVYSSSMA